MSDFYTNFFLRGKNLYLRGIKDGVPYRKKHPIKPTLYLHSKDEHDFKTLDGTYLKPVNFSTPKELKEYAKEAKDSGQSVYGFPRFEYTAIDSLYPGESVAFDYNEIRTLFLDIEVESENGFPDPNRADEIVNAITVGYLDSSGSSVFECFGIEALDLDAMTHPPTNYTLCHSEEELLEKFLTLWEDLSPDILTGWNVEQFDMIYMYNRVEKILGEGEGSRFSPWGFVNKRKISNMYGDSEVLEVDGVSILDYLDLYKKFTYTMQESYKLDYIAEVELGEKKLDYSEYGSLHTLYKENYTKYLDYNIKDVDLVIRLEAKKKLIKLACMIAYSGKTNYNDVFMNVRMWDVIVANTLRWEGVQVPFFSSASKDDAYEGAYVKDPLRGKYQWVASFDLTSLYPSIIMQYNISPETMLDEKHDLSSSDVLQRTERYEAARRYALENNAAMAANGTFYSNDIDGILPRLMKKFFAKRKSEKKSKLKYEQMLQQVELELEKRGIQ